MFALKTTLQQSRACKHVVRGYAEQVAIGINIQKTGSDPPYKSASEYPDWLKDLASPRQTLYELRRKMQTQGEDSITDEETVRMVKLANREKIKENNTSKAKA